MRGAAPLSRKNILNETATQQRPDERHAILQAINVQHVDFPVDLTFIVDNLNLLATMKTFSVLALALCLLASVQAFTGLPLATRAVAPAKKAAPKKITKAVPKKVVKKVVAPKKVAAKKPAAKARPAPKTFSAAGGQVKALSASRVRKNVDFAYDDGLTELERRQRAAGLTTFLTGSAKPAKDAAQNTRGDLADVGNFYTFSPFDTSVIFAFCTLLVGVIIAGGQ